MVTHSRLLLSHLRRSRALFPSSAVSLARVLPLAANSPPPPPSHQQLLLPLASGYFPVYRSFSTAVDGGDVSFEDSISPVRALISLIDGFHDLSGLPWWITIVASTVAFRIALLPVILLQLHKLKKIGEYFPKLPPPLPPPLSGRSYIEQILHFRKERKAVGCPSYLWFLSSYAIQVPCFLLGVTSIRRMSLDHHPGFDCGGAFWFQNLTEFPHGAFGPIFPIIIASLHYMNVQISFRRNSIQEGSDLFTTLAKWYKRYLDFMTLPIFLIGYSIPQGSLVYWVTNSTFTFIQHVSLNHSTVRAKLGLPDEGAIKKIANSDETSADGVQCVKSTSGKGMISVKNLTPETLLKLAVKFSSEGQKEEAISYLRLALDKDPDCVRAMVLMGQNLMHMGRLVEGCEYLEQAISKFLVNGHPTEVENVGLLILASQWAGVMYINQGKKAEGLKHLERIAGMKEPEDPSSRRHYYTGLFLLASALSDAGRKDEAIKYMRLVVAVDPACKPLLEDLENEDNFVSDLVSSRRGDY